MTPSTFYYLYFILRNIQSQMYDVKMDVTRKMCGYGCDTNGKMCDNSVEVTRIL